jgi:hypothetical protein
LLSQITLDGSVSRCPTQLSFSLSLSLSISQLTVSRLSRQCGILNIPQPYRPPRLVTEIALFFLFLHLSAIRCSCEVPLPVFAGNISTVLTFKKRGETLANLVDGPTRVMAYITVGNPCPKESSNMNRWVERLCWQGKHQTVLMLGSLFDLKDGGGYSKHRNLLFANYTSSGPRRPCHSVVFSLRPFSRRGNVHEKSHLVPNFQV